MSFDDLETGIATGKPVRLYLFERGLLKWCYCSADRDITYELHVYKHVSLADDGIRQSGEASADALKITAPGDIDVASQYRVVAPSAEIRLTVIDLHYGDLLGRVRWSGSIRDVSWPAQDRCEMVCQPLASSMAQPGLKGVWARGCPHTLYDNNCQAPGAVVRVSAVLATVASTEIAAAAAATKPDGYFAGGFVEWNIGGGEMERRGIMEHVGTSLKLLSLSNGMTAGTDVFLYPGCAGDIQTCNDKFNNLANYGGAPGMPGVSPFDGTPIY